MTGPYRMRRAYDEPETDDGARVLVDRLWPRGLSKERAHLDSWEKDAAPSGELRRWYHHRAERRAEFVERYRAELGDETHTRALERIRSMAEDGPVTLLTATKEISASELPILVDALRAQD